MEKYNPKKIEKKWPRRNFLKKNSGGQAKYNPQKIEKKWQIEWDKQEIYKAENPPARNATQSIAGGPARNAVATAGGKKYILIEFPYPSGAGLHVGHCRPYCALDALARKKKMEGNNVLFPIGWDAFGLPTENFAIKNKIHPKKATEKNIANFKKQIKSLGLSFDWSREINTTDPKYYKWTQWIFLKLFEKGLAYQAEMPINWCPSCKIGLANEEVVDGKCERCGAITEKKIRKQWMLKITAYADKLIKGLEKVDYPERVKTQQINWIGKSEGADVDFKIDGLDEKIRIYTTRPDTLFGATFLVLSPEHALVSKITIDDRKTDVKKYQKESLRKSDLERIEAREKTGVFVGRYAINPVNNKKIPIWIADYVLFSYGYGAIMAVPAHDERDSEFAKKYGLPIKFVIHPGVQFDINADINTIKKMIEMIKKYPAKYKSVEVVRENKGYKLFASDSIELDNFLKQFDFRRSQWFQDNEAQFLRCSEEKPYLGIGVLKNSRSFNGMNSEKVKDEIVKFLAERKMAKKAVNYKLRDWIFSRQHYWGEPIPLVHCKKCGIVPIPEKDLPVELPYVENYQPTKTGESPLTNISKWVNVKCPKCESEAKRETDTMPNWAGSSWYFLRYLDSKNDKALADFKKIKYWMPVDFYNGGMEHTTLHLLYSRFWHKFLFDIGVVPQDEPYQKRTSHGMVLAEDGRKMSKSFGNVINPDDVVEKFGADSLRLYEMFMGPFEQTISWNTDGLVGMRRFLERVWKVVNKIIYDKKKLKNKKSKFIHKTIKKITEDIENFKFNTAIAALIIQFNGLNGKPDWRGKLSRGEWESEEFDFDALENFLILLSPFAPHISEELWQKLDHKKSIFEEEWPKYNPELIREEKINLIIQINGKVRDQIEVDAEILEQEAKEIALSQEKVVKWIKGKEIKKVIFVKGKLINIVV